MPSLTLESDPAGLLAEGDPAALEMLPGSVVAQYIRCGKPECHCMQGGDKHGPYFYRMWREGRKVHKVYIKKFDLEQVRAACAAYRTHLRRSSSGR